MDTIYKKLFQSFFRFHKLKFSAIMPDVSKTECSMLIMVEKYASGQEKGIRMSELADKMNVSAPAVSRMVNNMEERHLLERYFDGGNRRNTYIRLTAKGHKKILEVDVAMEQLMSKVFEHQEQQQIEQIIALMDDIYIRIKNELELAQKQGKDKKDDTDI